MAKQQLNIKPMPKNADECETNAERLEFAYRTTAKLIRLERQYGAGQVKLEDQSKIDIPSEAVQNMKSYAVGLRNEAVKALNGLTAGD